MSQRQQELAAQWTVPDIFVVNGAMLHATDEQREAWARCRAMIVKDIPPPTIVIPPELLDEDGFIIPGKVANPG